MTGRVRMYSDFRGYGFIAGDDGRDYFVHHTMIVANGLRSLLPDERVTFDPVETARGWQAWRATREPKASYTTAVRRRIRLKPNPFTPQDPVTDPHKFAGRAEPIANAIDCLFNNKNLLVSGARGIGKSSVAYQLLNLTRGDRTLLDRIGIETGEFEFRHYTGDHRCLPGQTLSAITEGLFRSLCANHEVEAREGQESTTTEWDLKLFKRSTERTAPAEPAVTEVALGFALATERVLRVSTAPTTGICYLIDEVDVLQSEVQLAPFLKAVVEKLRLDGFSTVSFVLSGVTGSITELVAQHPSAARLTEMLTLQAMGPEELLEIIASALSETGTRITPEAAEAIVELSGNFPAPVQLLGYHAFRISSDDVIDLADVTTARDFVIREIKRQDFQGRLDRLGGGTAGDILKVLAGPTSRDMTVERIANRLEEGSGRIAGVLGNLVRDGFVNKKGSAYDIAEPLFKIYLKWVFGVS